jgi:hypothetical protein
MANLPNIAIRRSKIEDQDNTHLPRCRCFRRHGTGCASVAFPRAKHGRGAVSYRLQHDVGLERIAREQLDRAQGVI